MNTHQMIFSLSMSVALSLPGLAGAQMFGDIDRDDWFAFQTPARAAVAAMPTRGVPSVASDNQATPTGFGWRLTSGKGEWVFVGHQYVLRDGKLVCVDGIDHGTRADVTPLDESIPSGG